MISLLYAPDILMNFTRFSYDGVTLRYWSRRFDFYTASLLQVMRSIVACRYFSTLVRYYQDVHIAAIRAFSSELWYYKERHATIDLID